MNIVLDTNILVSAAWSPGNNAGNILNAAFARRFTACYDYRILEEYIKVLRVSHLNATRPTGNFTKLPNSAMLY